jgi:hypothetical protein
MKQSTTTIKMPEYESSPKFILSTTKLICNWLGKYYRAVETKDFIYFCNYQEGDENASVKMYRKSDLSLVSDNWMGYNVLMGVILEKEYTYLSHSMKFNAREMQKENAKEKELEETEAF